VRPAEYIFALDLIGSVFGEYTRVVASLRRPRRKFSPNDVRTNVDVFSDVGRYET
jgi:hypothetical protein